jgi:hypothetical protein
MPRCRSRTFPPPPPELDRALGLPGMVGAQLPANGFLTGKAAEKMRPLLEVANRHRAFIFIHHGPLPGDAFPKIAGDTDNARRRNGTLDMQASLSSAMVTLCLTDFLAPYPDATIYLHNLGGNIPFEVERMDHRCLLDTPKEELPSARFRRSKVYVDCNSFGPRAIEAGVRLYGAERIVCGTDGTEFGVNWTLKAIADAEIGEEGARGYPAPQCRRDARALRDGHAARKSGCVISNSDQILETIEVCPQLFSYENAVRPRLETDRLTKSDWTMLMGEV